MLKSIVPKSRVELCAPTGKAAAHLAEVTGTPAKTIHCLKNRKINCDFLIVDKASMVDVALLRDLLKVVSSSSIGDDICFIRLREASEIEQKVVEIAKSLKDMGNLSYDIQVLVSTREWARNLKLRLKSVFNPVSDGQESESYLIGDRVIYRENNYAWRLHNGQEGTVSSVMEEAITVRYGGRIIRHAEADMEHLELAYALTIHKAQGSEYPIVIIPVAESMGRTLNRNMIYTALTRARAKCIIVGSGQALRMALDTTLSDAHRSLLAERLRRI